MIYSFDPIIDENCKILILGTAPGGKSLEKQQYYAHRQNQFWRIIYDLFEEELHDDYKSRKNFLLSKGIALWDVLKSCDRTGSSDSNIRNPVPFNFKEFFLQYPGIKVVYFDSRMAEHLFFKLVDKKDYPEYLSFHRLPSTSPAYAISYERKLELWKAILLML